MAKGINFSPVATDIAESMDVAVKYILSLNISPDNKISRLSKIFNLVGSDFYVQMFDANSQLFDSTAIGTDYYDMTDQINRLANKIVQNYNLGRPIDVLVKDFYDSALGKAQHEAFRNAVSLDKHPTLTRSIVGETCRWCIDKAGVHVNPGPELFARHSHCDCLFVTSGYNSRNGILTNYSKDLSPISNRKLNDLTKDEIEKLSKEFDDKYYKPNSAHKKVYFDGNGPQAKFNEMQFQMGNFIQEKTGYSQQYPQVVSREEYEKIKGKKIGGSEKIYRGWHGTNAKNTNKFVNEFMTGTIYNNYSSRGYGSYFSSDVETANMYASTSDSILTEAKVAKDARVLTIKGGQAKFEEMRFKLASELGFKYTILNATSADVLASDIGSLAALSGYDIVELSDDLQKIVLVLNREKVIIPND